LLPRYVSQTNGVAGNIRHHGYEDDKGPELVVARGHNGRGAFFASKVDEAECHRAQRETGDHDGDRPEENAAAANAVDRVEGDEGEDEVCEGDGQGG
jgi:hypothetical protein